MSATRTWGGSIGLRAGIAQWANSLQGRQQSATLHLYDIASLLVGGAYTFLTLTNRPRSPLVIDRIYLPLTVAGYAAASGTPPLPTVARLSFVLQVRGIPAWSYDVGVPLLPTTAAGPMYFAGDGLISDDLVNPVELDLTDDIDGLQARVTFDQNVAQAWLYVGATNADPTNGQPTPAAGSAHYTIIG